MPHPTWLDISLPIAPESVAWEGLARPRLDWLARIEEGSAVNVARLDCCLHTGTHADAPLHVNAEGIAVERMDPSRFVGPARVLRTESPEHIGKHELQALGIESRRGRPEIERILIATPSQYDGLDFPRAIPHLEEEAAEFLLDLGARLIGVNVPSLDPLDSREMKAHRRVFDREGAVLENLDLRGIAAGRYELVAAPLKVAGADAAPVRALLRPVGG